jgi:hypothetical protein
MLPCFYGEDLDLIEIEKYIINDKLNSFIVEFATEEGEDFGLNSKPFKCFTFLDVNKILKEGQLNYGKILFKPELFFENDNGKLV